ncbi:MAG: PhoPQ-activated pathogenicity-related family protein [Planctomycetaceae bacterium]|nr:PhoPQ-activated pathogenicity-related family protein [Planctomycetaceae bacterium]
MRNYQLTWGSVAVSGFFAAVFFTASFAAEAFGVPPELDTYLSLADKTYQWKILERNTDASQKAWFVELTSQTWHGIPWKHIMVIVEPKQLDYPDKALLFITGGSIGRRPSHGDMDQVRRIAEKVNAYAVLLLQVPNQPLLGDYREDALIGETLLKALAENDTTWPALFPMAKSAIRAMDAAQEILRQERHQEVESFVVSGASKRGWTTWLTAASGDKRVIAIAPIVIDTLNLSRQMQYQLETWGDWSPSIHDYTSRRLIDKNPDNMSEFKKRLWIIIDPYYYRSRLTLPKLLIHATNDPYWTLDATRNYWDDLTGVKYIATFPNVGHDLGNEQPRAFLSVAVFAKYAFENKGNSWPEMTWTSGENTDGDYTLKVVTEIPDCTAKLWTAHSDSKDFRQSVWGSKDLNASGETGLYEAVIPKPEKGHVAFYMELESIWFDTPFSLTTQVFRK